MIPFVPSVANCTRKTIVWLNFLIENFKYLHKLTIKVPFSLNVDKNEIAYSTTV